MGTLGLNLFENVDIELDFPKKKMSLYSTDYCATSPVYWSNQYASIPMKRDARTGAMYFEMNLDGQKLQTTLSTGSRVQS